MEHAAKVVEAAVARARERGWTVVDVDNEAEGVEGLRSGVVAAADLLRPAGAIAGGAA